MGDGPVPAGRRWRERLDRLARLAGGSTARRVLARYGATGGSLLANGPAFTACFAIVPAFVVALGVAVPLLGSTTDRSSLIQAAGRAFPPLLDLLGPVSEELDRLSGSITVIGLVGFVWGASRFSVALQDALELVFGGTARRGLIGRQLLALGSVALLVVAVVALALLASVASFIEGAVSSGGPTELVSPVVALLVTISGPVIGAVALAAVYRFVPPARPSWSDALLPAFVVGAALTIATRLFVILAPRLVGGAAVFGSLVTVFVALAWFSATFQALLIGASWVSDRAAQRAAAAEADQPST